MLQLKNITKTYKIGDFTQDALKDVSVNFRENEFVSILGPSGSGKTTLLNLVGGLDRYTKGDLVINNISTKNYKDRDWDSYRNHSIGFIFQNYNLIPHQSILANVELALTLAGASKSLRREKAVEVLKEVGLEDHIYKRPNQLSGGQMQRVAIARALINNPDILLADEPTGALDSETSLQIMALLKEIAKDKLVIMVTHNPNLAKNYSTRIIELLDGEIIGDSNPYKDLEDKDRPINKKERVSMSFFTALSLSFSNLKTKKGRTILTAFAGSIGIIGIALILSLSSGMRDYIVSVEEDTLSSYPIAIQSQTIDMSQMEENQENRPGFPEEEAEEDLDENMIYQSGYLANSLRRRTIVMQNNNLEAFKNYLESPDGQDIVDNTNAIQYGYDIDLQIYSPKTEDGIIQIHPSPPYQDDTPEFAREFRDSLGGSENIWTEMMDNKDLLSSQYDVLAGKWPENYNELVLIVNENNKIRDMDLYTLGLKSREEYQEIEKKIQDGERVEEGDYEIKSFTYDELLELEYKLIVKTDYYEKSNDIWLDRSDNDDFIKDLLEDALTLKVVGIIRPSDEAAAASINGRLGYTKELTNYYIDEINSSEIVLEQKENPDIDIFSGKEFADPEEDQDFDENQLFEMMTEEQRAYFATLSSEERADFMESFSPVSQATYEGNIEKLGLIDLDKPSSINLYLKTFNSREKVVDLISAYNIQHLEDGNEEYVIYYTDIVGMMIASMVSIIDMITYALIGFVSISLVVSSIMIGIITYISVLERTKEIGILRSVGASKRDISRVFNAETFIIGLISGGLGIGITILLNIPASSIIEGLSGVAGISKLPFYGGVSLIIISVILTTIAGIIPSRIAAKKDPVEALRSE